MDFLKNKKETQKIRAFLLQTALKLYIVLWPKLLQKMAHFWLKTVGASIMCSILFNKILQDLSRNTSKKNLLTSSPRRFGRDQNAILSTKNTCLGQKMALLQRLDISILCIIQVSIFFIIKGIMIRMSFLMCRAMH